MCAGLKVPVRDFPQEVALQAQTNTLLKVMTILLQMITQNITEHDKLYSSDP